jgi:hypothetical protein
MKRLLVTGVVLLLTLSSAAARADQTLVGVETSSLQSLAESQQPSQARGTRDSLKNGAVIGALVGAATLGGFGLFLCHALDDTGDPNCFPGLLPAAALGAGIGAGAGIAIDALLVRQPALFPSRPPAVAVRVRIGFGAR